MKYHCIAAYNFLKSGLKKESLQKVLNINTNPQKTDYQTKTKRNLKFLM